MKKLIITTCAIVLSLYSVTALAIGGSCAKSLKNATEKASKDPQCKAKANDLFYKYKRQVRTCEAFRDKKKDCRQNKRKSKRVCAAGSKSELNKCKQKRGKDKRQCKRRVRQAKKQCKQAARQEKRSCKKAAKHTREFEICKDARKLTKKTAGSAVKCASKYYTGPLSTCIADFVL